MVALLLTHQLRARSPDVRTAVGYHKISRGISFVANGSTAALFNLFTHLYPTRQFLFNFWSLKKGQKDSTKDTVNRFHPSMKPDLYGVDMVDIAL